MTTEGCGSILSSLTRASSDDGPQLFYETRAVGLAHRLLALAAAAAEEAGYFGNWTLAFGATGMRGSESSLRSGDLDINTHPYPENQYTESTAASYADLTQQPCALVDQLVGRLLRGFGTRHAFLPALVDLASSPAAK